MCYWVAVGLLRAFIVFLPVCQEPGPPTCCWKAFALKLAAVMFLITINESQLSIRHQAVVGHCGLWALHGSIEVHTPAPTLI